MWHTIELEEIKHKLKTNFEKGLNNNEVEKRKAIYGSNEFAEGKKSNIFIKFLNQFKDFMIIILIAAAIVSAVISYLEHTNEYIDSIIIITIVVLNAIMGVIQESKAEKSLEALKKMSAPKCKVRRNGNVVQISNSELVPGDIIILETGCFVPADVRLIKTFNLKVEESALTRGNSCSRKKCRCTINRKSTSWRYGEYGIFKYNGCISDMQKLLLQKQG